MNYTLYTYATLFQESARLLILTQETLSALSANQHRLCIPLMNTLTASLSDTMSALCIIPLSGDLNCGKYTEHAHIFSTHSLYICFWNAVVMEGEEFRLDILISENQIHLFLELRYIYNRKPKQFSERIKLKNDYFQDRHMYNTNA